ncbi:hypothetical protein BaRGS_00013424 [Batillaria attramentaria]|uniref:Uncharacterized protein n=1 Tax=Batillaria attramentaria TaxID=370345 RepID=A0ABD0L6Z4_9CAEN
MRDKSPGDEAAAYICMTLGHNMEWGVRGICHLIPVKQHCITSEAGYARSVFTAWRNNTRPTHGSPQLQCTSSALLLSRHAVPDSISIHSYSQTHTRPKSVSSPQRQPASSKQWAHTSQVFSLVDVGANRRKSDIHFPAILSGQKVKWQAPIFGSTLLNTSALGQPTESNFALPSPLSKGVNFDLYVLGLSSFVTEKHHQRGLENSGYTRSWFRRKKEGSGRGFDTELTTITSHEPKIGPENVA